MNVMEVAPWKQLKLDGGEVEHDPRRPGAPDGWSKLSPVQQGICAFIRRHGSISPIIAGTIQHHVAAQKARDYGAYLAARMEYRSTDGARALRRLSDRGIVQRVARGDWRFSNGRN